MEFSQFGLSILNKLGYFGVSTTRILTTTSEDETTQKYVLTGTPTIGRILYWMLSLNCVIKVVFLTLLILGYFGQIEFLDFIAAVDYVLCFVLVALAASIWHCRYPLYEIIKDSCRCLNSIFTKVELNSELLSKVNYLQKYIVLNHSIIIWMGCFCLMIQYVADCKYVTFTYSIIEMDTTALRFLFGVHEFLFMNLAWNAYAGSCSLCIFQGIALSNVIDKMRVNLQRVYDPKTTSRSVRQLNQKINLAPGSAQGLKLNQGKLIQDVQYNVDQIVMDYKRLMILCNQFNEHVSYRTLFMHIAGGCQFVSDVFAATHVLNLPGAGFMDVWFYIEDCFAAGFMLVRTYIYMALVYTSSQQFLQALNEYLISRSAQERRIQRRATRCIKVISLQVGPCAISPMSVLTVFNTIGNYYVCAALW